MKSCRSRTGFLAAIIVALASWGTVFLLTYTGLLGTVEQWTVDHRFILRGVRPPAEKIVIVEVNDETYRRLATDDPDILSIHMTSGLSGTYSAARAGAELVPEANVAFVDTKTLSAAAGWQVEAAARAVNLDDLTVPEAADFAALRLSRIGVDAALAAAGASAGDDVRIGDIVFTYEPAADNEDDE